MNKLMNKSEKITLDSLAIMINNGFKESHKNLLEVEQRLDKKIDYKFDGLQNQLDNIYINYIQRHEHATLKERVRKVERKVGILPIR